MPRTVTGIDVTPRGAACLRGHVKGNTFAATGFWSGRFRADSVPAAWDEVDPPFKLGRTRVGVTGREVNVRYSRVPRLPDWQLRKLMRFEVEEVGGSSAAEVAADFNVLPALPEIEDEDVVLLAMARENLLEEHADGLTEVGGGLDAFTPNSIALYAAWVRFGVVMDDTVLLANVGHETIDVVLVRGADLVFARNLGGGTGPLVDAVAERLSCSVPKAEQVLFQKADLAPDADHGEPTFEKASRAAQGPAGQLVGLLQSTVQLAKSQLKITSLSLDRVFVCGAGAQVPGLVAYLGRGLGVSCEEFDPFAVVDTAKLPADQAQALERDKARAVIALGLATGGSDSDAYSIEILPASVEKRREFWSGPALLIAAAVVALLYLGLRFQNERAALGELSAERATKERELKRRQRDHAATEAYLRENEELAEYLTELYRLAGSGELVARSVVALDDTLPPGFWITEATLRESNDEELGAAKADPVPVLTVGGRAQEGIEPNSVPFQRLATALRAELPEARLVETLSPNGSQFELRLTTLTGPEPAPEGEE